MENETHVLSVVNCATRSNLPRFRLITVHLTMTLAVYTMAQKLQAEVSYANIKSQEHNIHRTAYLKKLALSSF